MRTLVWRLGFQKTGTTSAQGLLKRFQSEPTPYPVEALAPLLNGLTRASGAAPVFVFTTWAFAPWLRSAYRQEVKAQGLTARFEQWLGKIPFEQDWAPHRARIAAAVDAPVIFRDMGADAEEGLPMGGRLLVDAGVPVEAVAAMPAPPPANEALGDAAVEFLRQVNLLALDPRTSRSLRLTVDRHRGLFDPGLKLSDIQE